MSRDVPAVSGRGDGALLLGLVDQLPAMLAYWDTNLRCRFANRAYERWFGVAPESMIGRDLADFLGPLYALNKPYIEAALRGEEQQFEREIPDPAGGPPRYSQAHYLPDIVDGVVRGFGVLVVDITNRTRAEQVMRLMERKLVAAERFASMATLAAGIAHEINNPLATVLANLDLALERAATGGGDIAQLLAESRDSAVRLASIVQSMRLLARSDTTPREKVDIEDILGRSLDITDNAIRYRATLTRTGGDAGFVEANPAQLTQVFVNLLVNAAQAFGERAAERNAIRVTTSRRGGAIVVEIADNGVGIPDNLRARIFEPFFTTKDVGAGMGLGLSISHGIVTTLGGSIMVRDTPGGGSTFYVSLPATSPPAIVDRGKRPSSPPSAASASRRLRLLLVEDDVALGRSLRRLLEADHDVTVVTGGRAALHALAVPEPPFDVILCDLMMPEITGAEVYETVTRERPELAQRFVIMTGGAFTPRGQKFLAETSVPVLEKPFDPEALRSLVRERAAK